MQRVEATSSAYLFRNLIGDSSSQLEGHDAMEGSTSAAATFDPYREGNQEIEQASVQEMALSPTVGVLAWRSPGLRNRGIR